jgi:hypothetical protein
MGHLFVDNGYFHAFSAASLEFSLETSIHPGQSDSFSAVQNFRYQIFERLAAHSYLYLPMMISDVALLLRT